MKPKELKTKISHAHSLILSYCYLSLSISRVCYYMSLLVSVSATHQSTFATHSASAAGISGVLRRSVQQWQTVHCLLEEYLLTSCTLVEVEGM